MSLNELRDRCLQQANRNGWDDERSVGEDVALMHSELSEALEEHRNGARPDQTYYEDLDLSLFKKPLGIPTEMADTIIRILHFCGRHGIDIDKAVEEKLQYNDTRGYRHGGKVL